MNAAWLRRSFRVNEANVLMRAWEKMVAEGTAGSDHTARGVSLCPGLHSWIVKARVLNVTRKLLEIQAWQLKSRWMPQNVTST